MDVELSDGMADLHIIGHLELVVPLDPFQEMFVILAVNIVYMEDQPDESNIRAGQSLTKRPIHIHLAFSFLEIDHGARGETSMPCAQMASDPRDIRRIMCDFSVQLSTMPMTSRYLEQKENKIKDIRPGWLMTHIFGLLSLGQMRLVSGLIGHKRLSRREPDV